MDHSLAIKKSVQLMLFHKLYFNFLLTVFVAMDCCFMILFFIVLFYINTNNFCKIIINKFEFAKFKYIALNSIFHH